MHVVQTARIWRCRQAGIFLTNSMWSSLLNMMLNFANKPS
jgi:hypothetical protein